MTVYVEPLRSTPRTAHWPYDWGCHLFADSVPELMGFAEKIDLKPEWFQGGRDGGFPHYDLTVGKRIAAVKAGAVQLNWREVRRRARAERERRLRTKGVPR